MKKRIFVVTVCLLLLVCVFVACNPINPATNGTKSFDVGKKNFYKAELTDEFKTQLENKMNTAEALVDSGDDYDLFYSVWKSIWEEDYPYYSSVSSKSYIEYCMYMSDSAAAEKYQDIVAYNSVFAEWESKMYSKLASSNFRSKFYESMTDEEIDAFVGSLQGSSEISALDIENNEIQIRFRSLPDAEKRTEGLSLYSQLVENNKEIAKLSGYETYSEYAYAHIYRRDYAPENSESFYAYVKQYLLPLYLKLSEYENNLSYTLTEREINAVNDLISGSFFSSSVKSYADNFADSVGGEYLEEYKKLWNGGNYVFAYDYLQSYQGAFTISLPYENQSAVYFGPGYLDVLVVIHEFGHYLANCLSAGEDISNDLAETQSQGNETMFLSYLAKEYDSPVIELFTVYKLKSYLSSLMMSSIIDEFEQYVYQKEVAATEYETVLKSVISGYEGLPTSVAEGYISIWADVCVTSPCYYISYAVSLVAALELYVNSATDFKQATETYLYLVGNSELDFLTALQNASLSSPFDESVYVKLNSIAALLGI